MNDKLAIAWCDNGMVDGKFMQGVTGRLRKEHYPDRETAEGALVKLRDEQIRRGYRVVFIQAMPE